MFASTINLGLVLLLCFGVMADEGSSSPTEGKGAYRPVRPSITPMEEAMQIDYDAYPDNLLADPAVLDKHAANIKSIRRHFDRVAKVLNQGRHKAGQLEITNWSQELKDKINRSPYGPIKEVIDMEGQNPRQYPIVVFGKPYNPKALAKKLEELGVKSRLVWIRSGDFGHIEYSPEDKAYTFREGYDNCYPNCVDNHFWVFKFGTEKNPVLDNEYATDIPLPPKEAPRGS